MPPRLPSRSLRQAVLPSSPSISQLRAAFSSCRLLSKDIDSQTPSTSSPPPAPASSAPASPAFRTNATSAFTNDMRQSQRSARNTFSQQRRDTTSTPSRNIKTAAELAQSYHETKRARAESEAVIAGIERQQYRTWNEGDVYAPHDLSAVEHIKARYVRSGRAPRVLNSRNKGGKDVLDILQINPIKHYKNFAMLNEYMTSTGRIKHGRETGLRAVNQRKMAKAIRRAIGVGILPSVHVHPELMPERIKQRAYMRLS